MGRVQVWVLLLLGRSGLLQLLVGLSGCGSRLLVCPAVRRGLLIYRLAFSRFRLRLLWDRLKVVVDILGEERDVSHLESA